VWYYRLGNPFERWETLWLYTRVWLASHVRLDPHFNNNKGIQLGLSLGKMNLESSPWLQIPARFGRIYSLRFSGFSSWPAGDSN
jgi:hypothetical protein